MNKKTKFSKSVNEKVDSSKTYTLDEAISIIMEFKRASFVESVDVAYNLGAVSYTHLTLPTICSV